MKDTNLRVIYVAGPFRATNEDGTANQWEQEANIRRAEALALEVWRLGAAAICPHTNTRFYQGSAPDDVWLDGDLAILAKCDAVLLTDDWERSAGARAEVAFADANDIPTFQTLDSLRRWLAVPR
jgi:hypothetical protein